jgi:hypothetical protein
MKLVNALIVFALLCGGLLILIPMVSFAVAVAIVLGCAFLWLLPILIIANSDRTTGGEKLLWILAIIFLSWFAWILYFLVAPIKARPRYYY